MVAAETAGAISSTAAENRTPGVSWSGFSTTVDVSASFSVDSGAISDKRSAIVADMESITRDVCARVRVEVGQPSTGMLGETRETHQRRPEQADARQQKTEQPSGSNIDAKQ